VTDHDKSSKADYRGARGSNAGDQFHELWALQRALDLLNPASEFQALTVEGISTENPDADAGAFWDGVDCALYFGGHSLETADLVEHVQLKYSGSNPSAPWTIARLTENTRKTGNNSVLRKLAEDFVRARARLKSGARVAVKLISNQPLADNAAAILRPRTPGDDPPTGDDYSKVETATGLAGTDLSDFLAALDLKGCGSPSRFMFQEKVIGTIAAAIGDQADSQARDLQTRIRNLMLPEAAREVVTEEIVLGWFGIANREGLFPVPSALKSFTTGIDRAPAQCLLDALQGDARILCLHGPGGCGKTTTFVQVGRKLSAESAFIHFDCYGAGRYLRSNDRRHLPQHAFLQIANELSVKLGTPYLLAPGSRHPFDIRRFLDVLRRAGTLLQETSASAQIVIAIDAADNAVTAASNGVPPAHRLR
jgi:hypothetical protein